MAANPLRYVSIGQILGDMESAESLALPASLSSGGSKNLTIDWLSRATSILGVAQQTLVAVTSNTGGAPMRLRTLYHYTARDVNGGVLRQDLGVFDDGAGLHFELRVSVDSGVTWSFLVDWGVGHTNAIPDFAQLGNALAITKGQESAWKWDGAVISEISNSRLGAPIVTVDLTTAGAGQIIGTPFWRIVPITSAGRKVASLSSALTPMAGRKAVITWVADPDPTVVGYEVYRTAGAAGVGGGVFFFEGATASRTTVTFTSNTSDLDLIGGRVLREHGDAPPVGMTYCETHSSRTWYGRSNPYPRRWYYSDPGLPYSVFQDSNFFDATDAESFSDVSTGGTGGFQGKFVIWLERSVWTVSGTGAYNGAVVDYQLKRKSARTGTVHHRTVARVPAGATYRDESGGLQTTSAVMLAYLTPYKDIRLFDGDNDTIISAPKATALGRLTYEARAKSFVITDTLRNEFTWVYPADDDSEPSYAVTWNYRYGVWYDRPDWASLACGLETEALNDASVILAGEAALSGVCYKLWSGFTIRGTFPDARYMTSTLYGAASTTEAAKGVTQAVLMSIEKTWRWVDVLVRTTGPLKLLFEWLPTEAGDEEAAYGSEIVTLSKSDLETADLSLITTVDGSQLQAVIPTQIVRVKFRCATDTGRYLHSRGIRLRVQATLGDPAEIGYQPHQWSLVGLNLAYQLSRSPVKEFRR